MAEEKGSTDCHCELKKWGIVEENVGFYRHKNVDYHVCVLTRRKAEEKMQEFLWYCMNAHIEFIIQGYCEIYNISLLFAYTYLVCVCGSSGDGRRRAI